MPRDASRPIGVLGLRNLTAAVDRLAAGAAWTAIGAVFSRGAPLLYAIIIARSLGREAAGEFAMVQSTGAAVLTLTGPGLHTVATRVFAQQREAGVDTAFSVGQIIRSAWTMGLIGAVALALAAGWTATHILGAGQLASATRTGGGLMVLFGTLSTVCAGALLGLHRFRSIAAANFVTGAIGVAGVSCGAIFGGVTGAALGLAVSYAAGYLVLRKALPKASSAQPPPRDSEGMQQFMRSSVLLGAAYAINGASNWAAMSGLARSSHGYADVALFAVANQWQTAILFIPSAFSIVLLPRLSGLLWRRDGPALRQTLAATLLVNVVLACAGIVVVVLCAQGLLRLYGPAFVGGEATIYAMAIASIPVTVANLTSQVMYAQGLMVGSLCAQTSYAAALLMLSGWLISDAGAFGLAVATAGAHCALIGANVVAIALDRRAARRAAKARG